MSKVGSASADVSPETSAEADPTFFARACPAQPALRRLYFRRRRSRHDALARSVSDAGSGTTGGVHRATAWRVMLSELVAGVPSSAVSTHLTVITEPGVLAWKSIVY